MPPKGIGQGPCRGHESLLALCVGVCGGVPAAEHLRDLEAFWEVDAPPGDIEPLEHWDYQQWGQVGGVENRRGVGMLHRWAAAPRPKRNYWHNELHNAALSKTERDNSNNEKKERHNAQEKRIKQQRNKTQAENTDMPHQIRNMKKRRS